MAQFGKIIRKGRGRPIVLLHGWSVDSSFFAPQMALAAQGFDVMAPDLPGHGALRHADAPTGIADISAALGDFLSREKLEDVVLVGWSMGAAVALDYLARERFSPVSALAIVDMAPRVSNDESWSLGLSSGHTRDDMHRMAAKFARNWPKAAGRIARSLFPLGAKPDAELLEAAEAIITRNDPAVMADLWRSLASYDIRAFLGTIDLPVAVLLGAKSAVYPPELADWYRGHVPRCQISVFERAGHAPQLDAPEAFNAWLAAIAAP